MAVNVYMITNTVNGKQYIGITIASVEKRWKGHVSRAKEKHCKFALAILKYGKDAFTLQTLVVCPDRAYAVDMERKLIALYDTMNSGYNTTPGGEGTSEMPKEIRIANFEKAWDARRGKPMTEEHKRKIGAANKGRKPVSTPEIREKIATARRGKKFDPEWKARISESITAWHAARKAAKLAAAQE